MIICLRRSLLVTTEQNICQLQLCEIPCIIFCLIELCPLPSAQNITFISDTDPQKMDHLLMREGQLPLFVDDSGISLYQSTETVLTRKRKAVVFYKDLCNSMTTRQTPSAEDGRIIESKAPELIDLDRISPQYVYLHFNKGKILWPYVSQWQRREYSVVKGLVV